MNKAEAKEILAQELVHLQGQSFEELQELVHSPEVIELAGASGISYQIEVQAVWDDPRESSGDLRIITSIDDGRFFSALVPLTADFVIDSEGTVK